jgi:mannosyl-3-phosphoglycerate phosphatase family protein
MSTTLIITDLDGTLLDHDDYSFDAASEALSEIKRRGYPLILASSKTRLEMVQWQQRLGISYPFICENGAAICSAGGEEVEALAPSRAEVLSVLAGLRESRGYHFTGFNDCSVDELMLLTDLSAEDAELAASREYTEPLLWQDSDTRLGEFRMALAEHSLQALQGGRFLSISGCCDKAVAVQHLLSQYPESQRIQTVVLGDSPNDASMLATADIAVIIESAHSAELKPTGPDRIIRTSASGPRGWQEAMDILLATPHIFPAED